MTNINTNPWTRPLPRIGGFALGGYLCKCITCGEVFGGDKRAVTCLSCALDALTAEGATGTPEGWRAIECMRLINALRAEEGDEVTILCDNPDFNSQPNYVVECCGGWTRFGDQRFGGETLLDALSLAWINHQRPSPNPPVRPEQSASEPGRSSTTPTEGPAPVEAPHSVGNVRVTADGAVEQAFQVERDESAVRRWIMQYDLAADGIPTLTKNQALAALGRLADGARR